MNTKPANYAEVLKTEFSAKYADDVLRGEQWKMKDKRRFIELCQNAMVVSFHRYGYVKDGCGPGKASIPIESIQPRLDLYESGGLIKGEQQLPGNVEWLTDVFNFAMIESMSPRSPLKKGKVTLSASDNRPDQIVAQVALFEKDRKYERLVAIGKLALAEFCDPQHPQAHYKGTDVSPGRMTVEGVSERRNIASNVSQFR